MLTCRDSISVFDAASEACRVADLLSASVCLSFGWLATLSYSACKPFTYKHMPTFEFLLYVEYTWIWGMGRKACNKIGSRYGAFPIATLQYAAQQLLHYNSLDTLKWRRATADSNLFFFLVMFGRTLAKRNIEMSPFGLWSSVHYVHHDEETWSFFECITSGKFYAMSPGISELQLPYDSHQYIVDCFVIWGWSMLTIMSKLYAVRSKPCLLEKSGLLKLRQLKLADCQPQLPYHKIHHQAKHS